MFVNFKFTNSKDCKARIHASRPWYVGGDSLPAHPQPLAGHCRTITLAQAVFRLQALL